MDLRQQKKLEAMKKKRNSYPQKIIAVTGHSIEKNREEYYAAGFDEVVAKPIDKKVLLNLIYKDEKEKDIFSREEVCEKLLSYITEYLKNKRKDYDELVDARNNDDFDKIDKVCHRILGTAQTYGFNTLHDLVEEIQLRSKEENREIIDLKLKDLDEYLKKNL